MGNLIEDPSVGLEIDDDDRLFEIIDGIRVEKPTGNAEILLTNWLAIAINAFALPLRLGMAYVEMPIDFGQGDQLQLRPDLIYVSNERSSLKKRLIPKADSWTIVPELVEDVVSPAMSAFDGWRGSGLDRLSRVCDGPHP